MKKRRNVPAVQASWWPVEPPSTSASRHQTPTHRACTGQAYISLSRQIHRIIIAYLCGVKPASRRGIAAPCLPEAASSVSLPQLNLEVQVCSLSVSVRDANASTPLRQERIAQHTERKVAPTSWREVLRQSDRETVFPARGTPALPRFSQLRSNVGGSYPPTEPPFFFFVLYNVRGRIYMLAVRCVTVFPSRLRRIGCTFPVSAEYR